MARHYRKDPTKAEGYAYDTIQGTNSLNSEGPTDDVVEAWRFDSGGDIWGSPAVVDGRLHFGSGSGSLYSLEGKSGNEVWETELRGDIIPPPTVVDGVAYVSSTKMNSGDALLGSVYAVDTEDGEVLWEKQNEKRVLSPPAVVDGSVLFGSRDSNFYSVDAESGETEWVFRGAEDAFCGSKASVKGGEVYIGNHDNSLYALGVDTGEKLWELVSGDVVYVGSNDSNIYSIRNVVGYGDAEGAESREIKAES